MQTITPSIAKTMIDQDEAVLIDIRNNDEIEAEEIVSARFLPMEIATSDRILAVSGGKKAILICRSGSRAKKVATELEPNNENIFVVDGGLLEWKKKFPTVQGTKTLPVSRQLFITIGTLVLLTLALGIAAPGFYWVTAFIGCGLIFSGVTGFCAMQKIIMLMPWNKKGCRSGCDIKS